MHENICDDDAGNENSLHIHAIIIILASVQLLIEELQLSYLESTAPRSSG